MNKEIENGVASVKKFAVDSYRFLEVCEKPDVAGISV
jgi:preprotein translocase subunit Sss1